MCGVLCWLVLSCLVLCSVCEAFCWFCGVLVCVVVVVFVVVCGYVLLCCVVVCCCGVYFVLCCCALACVGVCRCALCWCVGVLLYLIVWCGWLPPFRCDSLRIVVFSCVVVLFVRWLFCCVFVLCVV